MGILNTFSMETHLSDHQEIKTMPNKKEKIIEKLSGKQIDQIEGLITAIESS